MYKVTVNKILANSKQSQLKIPSTWESQPYPYGGLLLICHWQSEILFVLEVYDTVLRDMAAENKELVYKAGNKPFHVVALYY